MDKPEFPQRKALADAAQAYLDHVGTAASWLGEAVDTAWVEQLREREVELRAALSAAVAEDRNRFTL